MNHGVEKRRLQTCSSVGIAAGKDLQKLGRAPMDFSTKLNECIIRVEQGLDTLLPKASVRPSRIHEAMRYSLQAGGKRLRPVLVLSSAELFGSSPLLDPL